MWAILLFICAAAYAADVGPENNFIRAGDMHIYREPNTRNAMTNKKWPDNTIPYTWHSTIHSERKRLIQDAMKDIETVVPNCWHFVKKDDSHKHWVQFQDKEDSCWSQQGYLGGGHHHTPQLINFGGTGCTPGGMVHELYHCLGMLHEHTRNDRDDFVEVLWDNINTDPNDDHTDDYVIDRKLGYETESFGTPYNFQSIMQYPFYVDDALNPKQPVLRNKRNKKAKHWDLDDEDIGQAYFLTHEDMILLAKRGGCDVPKTQQYNITNASPDDDLPSGRRPSGGYAKGLHLELKLKIKE